MGCVFSKCSRGLGKPLPVCVPVPKITTAWLYGSLHVKVTIFYNRPGLPPNTLRRIDYFIIKVQAFGVRSPGCAFIVGGLPPTSLKHSEVVLLHKR